MLLAYWAAPLLVALNPIQAVSLAGVLNDIRIDQRVLIFTVIVSLPSPPCNLSLLAPPSQLSSPSPPWSVSLPVPPVKVSSPFPPAIESGPSVPLSTSLPFVPRIGIGIPPELWLVSAPRGSSNTPSTT